MSFGDHLESIIAFAGDDFDAAVFYPKDDHFLIDRETTVNHDTVTEPARSTQDLGQRVPTLFIFTMAAAAGLTIFLA